MLTRRNLAALALWTASGAIGQSAFAAGPAPDILNEVNPEFRPQVRALLPFITRKPGAPIPPLAQRRADSRKYARRPAPLPAPQPERRLIPRSGGAPDVPVYLFNVSPGAKRPAVLYLHGGGYLLGSAAENLRDAQEVAMALDCVVVSVDYRLAPETPFPGSLEDNYAALRWLHDHAAELGADPARIALKGDSAGGGHAAALAIAARDRGEVPIVLQVLIYPMLDDRTGSSRLLPPQFGALVWTPEDNRQGWSALLGRPAGQGEPPPGAVPARELRLAGLPPAFIGVGSIDLFMSEDVEYARRLALAGVTTELLVVPGAFHGFDLLCPKAALTQAFVQAWQAALRQAFSNG